MGAEALPIVVRPFEEGDRAFVARSWLKSMRRDFPVPDREFYPVHSRVVNALLDRATTLVAADPEGLFHIYGFLCHGPGAVHYVYTKQLFRGAAVARRLLDAAGIKRGAKATYLPRKALAFARHVGLEHDPYLLVAEVF